MKVYLLQVAPGNVLGVITDPVHAERVAEHLKSNAGTDLHDLSIVPMVTDLLVPMVEPDYDGKTIQDRLLTRAHSWLMLLAKNLSPEPDTVHMTVKLLDRQTGQTRDVDLALTDLLNDIRGAVGTIQEDIF